MSIVAKSLSRENESLAILEKIVNAGLEFTLIGGYAVAARGRHRYSVDCDIVVAELGEFQKLLKRQGYRMVKNSDLFHDIYGAESCRFIKDIEGNEVWVDIFVKSLVVRQTSASWSFEYLTRYSSLADVTGAQREVREVIVLEKEMLIATKIHSARPQDIRDIVMLAIDGKVDWNKVARHTKRDRLEAVEKQIDFVLSKLDDPKLGNDLKSEFMVKGDISNELAKTKTGLKLVLDAIS